MGCDSESGEDFEAVKTHQGVKNIQDDSDADCEQKIHSCPYKGCGRVFSRPWRLASHICSHTGERPYRCNVPTCGKAYSNSSHLRRHVATSHKSSADTKLTYKCSYPGCCLELSNEQNLKRHYIRKHKKKSPFSCNICDKGFIKHSQLKTHIYVHTGVPPYKCSVCNIGFTSQRELKRHKRGHKLYKCDNPNCDNEFPNWSQLQTHILLNHPSVFTCNICSKSFNAKCRLRIHMAVHQETSTREVFSCPYDHCPKFYYQNRNLLHHIRTSHEGKKFKCTYPECDRELCTKRKLEYHMKLHDAKRPLPRKASKARKKRKDVGTHKRSMAVKMSGIVIPYVEERLLLNNKNVTLTDDESDSTTLNANDKSSDLSKDTNMKNHYSSMESTVTSYDETRNLTAERFEDINNIKFSN